MATTLVSTIDGILKDYYTQYFTDQISTFDKVQEIFETQDPETVQWEGRAAVEGVMVEYNEGVGAIGENANLPEAGSFKADQFRIPMKYIYGSIELTEQAMESSKTSKGAFKNVFRTQMETTIRNLKRERARALWGSGTGTLCRVNGAQTADATIEVDDPGGITGTVGGARFLRKNMIIAFNNGATQEAVRKITAVAADGASITIDAVATLTDNDTVHRVSLTTSTAAGDSGRNNECMGLMGMVDDGGLVGTFHNLSRTTYPVLKSRVAASVGALSLDAIQQNFDYAEQIGDSTIDCLACHYAVRRAYAALLEADRRYTGDSLMRPDGGTVVNQPRKYLTFSGIPIYESKFAPYGILFGLAKGEFKKYVQVRGEWAADDKGAILRQVTGKDAWGAFYRLWENYHLSRPNTCFRMDGITTTTIYVPSF